MKCGNCAMSITLPDRNQLNRRCNVAMKILGELSQTVDRECDAPEEKLASKINQLNERLYVYAGEISEIHNAITCIRKIQSKRRVERCLKS
ncbi:MAG: hypothetical protein JL50_08290 [Peptococcaceae bacterium BICA1-7]|nr:MAG: hypothetical protein JL50_08290 [Peptococcaceae bacterium BICA1-7]HBV97439.1 hypothetical protein [Desulfotomaculum sp.]